MGRRRADCAIPPARPPSCHQRLLSPVIVSSAASAKLDLPDPLRPVRVYLLNRRRWCDVGCQRCIWLGVGVAGVAVQRAGPDSGSAYHASGVHFLFLRLQAQLPCVRFSFDNQGLGGATSRDVLRVVRAAVATVAAGPDLAVLGVGINDVWRCFQNCPDQAVDLAEYRSNYASLLSTLTGWAGQVLCVTETPFGWDDTLDVIAMNKQLSEYNAAAMTIARQHEIPVAARSLKSMRRSRPTR